jgi:hypothetical protein
MVRGNPSNDSSMSAALTALIATLLDSAQKLLAANRPSESEYRSVRNYIESYNPLHDSEQEYIQHKQDLITLRPGRNHARLDRAIDGALRLLHKPFPFVNVSHRSPQRDKEVSLTRPP